MDCPGRGAAHAGAGSIVADDVGDLLEIPVFAEIAFSDGVVHVVGKQIGVFQIHAPVEIVVAVEKFRAIAIWNADVPELAAIADGLPLQGAKIERFAGRDRDVTEGKFSEDAIGDRVQLVAFRALPWGW